MRFIQLSVGPLNTNDIQGTWWFMISNEPWWASCGLHNIMTAFCWIQFQCIFILFNLCWWLDTCLPLSSASLYRSNYYILFLFFIFIISVCLNRVKRKGITDAADRESCLDDEFWWSYQPHGILFFMRKKCTSHIYTTVSNWLDPLNIP